MKSSKVEMKGKMLAEVSRMSVLTLMALTLSVGHDALALSKPAKSLWHTDGSKAVVATFTEPADKLAEKQTKARDLFSQGKHSEFIKAWASEPIAMLDAWATVMIDTMKDKSNLEDADKNKLKEAFLSEVVKADYGTTEEGDERFSIYEKLFEKMLAMSKADLDGGKYFLLINKDVRDGLALSTKKPQDGEKGKKAKKDKKTGERDGDDKKVAGIDCDALIQPFIKPLQDQVASLAAGLDKVGKTLSDFGNKFANQQVAQRPEVADQRRQARENSDALLAGLRNALANQDEQLRALGQGQEAQAPTATQPQLAQQQPQEQPQQDNSALPTPNIPQPQEPQQAQAAPSQLVENTPEFATKPIPNVRSVRNNIEAGVEEVTARGKQVDSKLAAIQQQQQLFQSFGANDPRAQMAIAQQTVQSLTTEKTNLLNDITRFKGDMKAWNETVARQEETLDKMKADPKNQAFVEGSQARLQQMQTQKSEFETFINSNKQNQQMAQAVSQRQGELDALSKRIQTEQQNMNAKIAALNPEFETAVKRLDEARKAGSDLKAQIASLESKASSLDTQISTAQGTFATAIAQLNAPQTSGQTRGALTQVPRSPGRGNAPTMQPTGSTQRLPLGK